MTLQEFITLYSGAVMRSTPILREGQIAYNLLSSVRPRLAFVIVGTDNDPYYQDENLPQFWQFLNDNW